MGQNTKKSKCAPPVKSENSSSESERNGDSSSSLSSSDSANESPEVKHKESKKCKLDKMETPKSSKHCKTSSANKEHKLKIKDDKEKKVNDNKDMEVEKKEVLQGGSEAQISLDTAGLHTVEDGGCISWDITQFNTLMNFVPVSTFHFSLFYVII